MGATFSRKVLTYSSPAPSTIATNELRPRPDGEWIVEV